MRPAPDAAATAPRRRRPFAATRRLRRRTLPVLALLASGPTIAAAGSLRLSEGLPFSDVQLNFPTHLPRVSADGLYAVYVHDAVVDRAYELWSVPLVGGDPVRLSGLLPASATVDHFELAADSQAVVYLAPQESSGVYELYSVPIEGPEGAWVKLNPELVAGGDVSEFALAPGAARVAFIADVETDGIADLWSVPVEGGTATRHRPTFTAVGSTALPDLAVSPAGERAAFRANFSGPAELWSARLDGVGGVVKLNGALAPGGTVQPHFRFSPDGTRVVYSADQEEAGMTELWSVPAADGTPVRLNGALVAGGGVRTFAFSPDGSRVVYAADQEVDERFELWSVPVAGGTAVKLNGPLVAGGDVDAYSYGISPDSTRVVYRADQQVDERIDLWSAPIAGGAAVKLNGALAVGGAILDFTFTPDGSRVVYRGDQQTDGAFELYAVPAGGGAAVRLNDPLVAGGRVLPGYEVTPDGEFVVYLADLAIAGRVELFRAPIVGGDADDERMSGDIVAGGDVRWLRLHPDGFRVLYVADQEVDERFDLYVGDPCLLCDGFEAGDFRRWN